MPSTEPVGPTPPALRQRLLAVAAASVRHGLRHGRALTVDPRDYPPALQAPRATFVTLELEGQLRGCIGTLEAVRPWVADVAENAYGAAFRDPRFPALRPEEYPRLHLAISVLSPAEPIRFSSEQDLLDQLRPGVDGLILSDGRRRGTFLPAVWAQLPDPVSFLGHLKLKAGLSPSHWSDTVRVERYTTDYFGAAVAKIETDHQPAPTA
jgi:AmmeMemoRadiSam system protein A